MYELSRYVCMCLLKKLKKLHFRGRFEEILSELGRSLDERWKVKRSLEEVEESREQTLSRGLSSDKLSGLPTGRVDRPAQGPKTTG